MPKTMTTNSATIESEDLLLEIFRRLPLYSTQRFLTACKQWESLIMSNPSFIKLRGKRNLQVPTGLVLGDSCLSLTQRLVELYPITAPPLRTDLRVVQSCNGLFLTMHMERVLKYHVYNPTTDMSRTLPELDGKVGTVEAMVLAFDPNRSLYYQVVCFVKVEFHKLRVYIYSSDTRTWKLVSKTFYGKVLNDGWFYWNGAIHCMEMSVYYDIKNEMFKKMPMPPDCDYWGINSYLGESCDRLNYTKLIRKSDSSCRVHLYELKRDYSEWVLKYKVDDMFSNTVVLSVVHGVEEHHSFLILRTGHRVKRYNLVSKKTEVLETVSLTGTSNDRAFQYIESQYCV